METPTITPCSTLWFKVWGQLKTIDPDQWQRYQHKGQGRKENSFRFILSAENSETGVGKILDIYV